jgi:uncharacterized protein (DUF362 family)
MTKIRVGRREFLSLLAAWPALAQQKQDTVIATATQDQTPRVGIVLSSFAGGEEHDGTKLAGLPDPRPVDADLDEKFIDVWVRKAIEMGSTRAAELRQMIEPEDWVVIKTNISASGGGTGLKFMPGSITDLRVVRAVLRYLGEHNCGARISLVEGSEYWQPAERAQGGVDGWSSDWGGAFGGLSYRSMIQELSKQFPKIRFEIADANFAPSSDLPGPGRTGAPVYTIARVLQQCDKLISIAPLQTDRRTGVALTFHNYVGFAPGSKYGFPKEGLWKLGAPEQVVVDLFNFHPADFCILGGPAGLEGDAPDGGGRSTVRHNLLVTGAKAVSVDAVAAALMGYDPATIPYLQLGEELGAYGTSQVDYVWTRGDEIDKARRPFRKPSGWKPAKPPAGA